MTHPPSSAHRPPTTDPLLSLLGPLAILPTWTPGRREEEERDRLRWRYLSESQEQCNSDLLTDFYLSAKNTGGTQSTHLLDAHVTQFSISLTGIIAILVHR